MSQGAVIRPEVTKLMSLKTQSTRKPKTKRGYKRHSQSGAYHMSPGRHAPLPLSHFPQASIQDQTEVKPGYIDTQQVGGDI